METSEFRNKMAEFGLNLKQSKIEDALMVMIDYYEVARVSQTRVGRFQMYGRPKLSKSVQKRIAKVVMEYSLTELDERDKPMYCLEVGGSYATSPRYLKEVPGVNTQYQGVNINFSVTQERSEAKAFTYDETIDVMGKLLFIKLQRRAL
ncbi:hypothetical protein MM193_00315 [Limosilactobacillus reuteri]|uniref:hypothetical protein n=1 Tax=Limosilactobacillus reuteri TaxID=1598 RepID=UPI001F4DC5B6|nr:hypothetical protein [Limosilactobacillus reuteri]MCH9393142.1 hypothetical protein [Limosilactobacillus reuteri]